MHQIIHRPAVVVASVVGLAATAALVTGALAAGQDRDHQAATHKTGQPTGQHAKPNADITMPATPTATQLPATGPFALVELFTSEGCSSCPPAEHVANRLAQRANAGEPLLVVAYHVDYWDSLGWPDRFAHSDHTRRQRRYASTWRERSVYTPQMVVDGRWGFVGSDAAKADQRIDHALAQLPALTLTPIVEPAEADRSLIVRVAVDQPAQPRDRTAPAAPDAAAEITVVVVESGLITEVTDGENTGRTLHHDNVVRAWASMPMPSATAATRTVETLVTLPEGLDRSRAMVIVYAQDARTLSVLGSGWASLPPVEAVPSTDAPR